MKCSDCAFVAISRSLLGGKSYSCHRFPPAVMPEITNSLPENRVSTEAVTVFPDVGKDMWCGEFRERAR